MRELLHGAQSASTVDPDNTFGVKKKQASKDLPAIRAELFSLQERLWAEQKRAVLVVLQGMDTSGKDGTIAHVMSGLDPTGVHVYGFKVPTPEELRHDFLWRIRKHVPPTGMVGVFNRSHYEDVLVVLVDNLAPPDVVERRYGRINRFEAELASAGVTMVKVMLHISFEEQRRRLIARLEEPTKHWKFSAADIDKRAQWGEYMQAYDIVLSRCSPPSAPWYVVPADAKWFRNYAVSYLLLETLREMNPRYPQRKLNVPRLLASLQASSSTVAPG